MFNYEKLEKRLRKMVENYTSIYTLKEIEEKLNDTTEVFDDVNEILAVEATTIPENWILVAEESDENIAIFSVTYNNDKKIDYRELPEIKLNFSTKEVDII